MSRSPSPIARPPTRWRPPLRLIDIPQIDLTLDEDSPEPTTAPVVTAPPKRQPADPFSWFDRVSRTESSSGSITGADFPSLLRPTPKSTLPSTAAPSLPVPGSQGRSTALPVPSHRIVIEIDDDSAVSQGSADDDTMPRLATPPSGRSLADSQRPPQHQAPQAQAQAQAQTTQRKSPLSISAKMKALWAEVAQDFAPEEKAPRDEPPQGLPPQVQATQRNAPLSSLGLGAATMKLFFGAPQGEAPHPEAPQDETPQAQTPKAAEWTTTKIETTLRSLSKNVLTDHAKLLHYTLEDISSQRPRSRQHLSSIDDLGDMKASPVEPAAGIQDVMKIKAKVRNQLPRNPIPA